MFSLRWCPTLRLEGLGSAPLYWRSWDYGVVSGVVVGMLTRVAGLGNIAGAGSESPDWGYTPISDNGLPRFHKEKKSKKEG